MYKRQIYVASGVWQDLGWDAIIYIAALASVNQELYASSPIVRSSSSVRQIHAGLLGFE